MNREEHKNIGTLAGLPVVAKYISEEVGNIENLTTKDLFITTGLILTSSFVSILPDILEPAHHSWHRSILHSKILLSILVGVGIYIWINRERLNLNRILMYFIESFIVGYSSHLLADSTTPRGLPLIK